MAGIGRISRAGRAASLVVAGLAIAAGLLACGSDAPATSASSTSDSGAPSLSSEPTSTFPPAKLPLVPSANRASAATDVGKAINNNGAIVTVRKVRSVTSVDLAGDRRAARDGGRFVIVSTTVKNKTRAAMDLTCGLPINTHLVDADGATYDPIDDLYKVSGNPECNASLNPGFSTKMTWAFEVPADVKVAGMTILENYRYRDQSQQTLISFSA